MRSSTSTISRMVVMVMIAFLLRMSGRAAISEYRQFSCPVGYASCGAGSVRRPEETNVNPDSSNPAPTPWSVAHKLIASHLVGGRMGAGEPIELAVDQTLTQDAT